MVSGFIKEQCPTWLRYLCVSPNITRKGRPLQPLGNLWEGEPLGVPFIPNPISLVGKAPHTMRGSEFESQTGYHKTNNGEFMTYFNNLEIRQLEDTGSGVLIAEILADVEGDRYVATGSSQCHPNDPYDPKVAMSLALGRAFRSLGRQLLKNGNAKVKRQDNVRLRQQEALERLRKQKEYRRELHQYTD